MDIYINVSVYNLNSYLRMIYTAIFSIILGALLGQSSAKLYHPYGLNETAYEPFLKSVSPDICFAHGVEALQSVVGELYACSKVKT